MQLVKELGFSMSENIENSSNPLDTVKWLVTLGLLGGVVAINHFFPELSILYIALITVAAVGIGGFILSTTVKGSTFIAFAKDNHPAIIKIL